MEPRQHPTEDGTQFYLSSLRQAVSSSALLDDPRLCALAAEDAAWCAALLDWDRRAPMGWQRRKLRRWNAEHEQLIAQRDQLRVLARSLGIPG